ncbi:MAG TPA: hypothetical protein VGB75_16195 [Jatrophihabitans sp.]|uniref:hypothetical protein n=1 Tax=Jatrophihabitans sp. TaxID=1932789 RepID=UPI002EE971E5
MLTTMIVLPNGQSGSAANWWPRRELAPPQPAGLVTAQPGAGLAQAGRGVRAA